MLSSEDDDAVPYILVEERSHMNEFHFQLCEYILVKKKKSLENMY